MELSQAPYFISILNLGRAGSKISEVSERLASAPRDTGKAGRSSSVLGYQSVILRQ